MSNFLRALLGLDLAGDADPPPDRGQLAAAALMVEAARLDGRFAAAEQERILELLTARFGLERAVAERLLAEAEAQAKASVDWHGFTSIIKDEFDHAGRVALVEMLWEVVYADGVVHDYEASLMRRVAGLLYITDAESAEARRAAMSRLDLPAGQS